MQENIHQSLKNNTVLQTSNIPHSERPENQKKH